MDLNLAVWPGPILQIPKPSSLDTATHEANIEIEYRNKLHASSGHFRRDFKRSIDLGSFYSIADLDGTDCGGTFLLRAKRKEIAAGSCETSRFTSVL